GYIARYQDAQDLANGIAWVLNHPEPEALSNACVQKVNRCYRQEIVAQQYHSLYETLLRK
ncbi:MAG: glycosyl transferase, partial [Bacteroidales bacterium]|nr:glycosyl transferase [Bacteroidales bacterium]